MRCACCMRWIVQQDLSTPRFRRGKSPRVGGHDVVVKVGKFQTFSGNGNADARATRNTTKYSYILLFHAIPSSSTQMVLCITLMKRNTSKSLTL